MTMTLARGTPYYMSPELKANMEGNSSGLGEFIPELCDIFSLGLTFLRVILELKEE